MDDYSFAKEDTDYSFAKPEEDYSFATPEKVEPTFKYATKDDYEDLKRNVGEVGYSGLDERQKALFKSQFPQSKFAKAGGTFEDAIKYTDAQSDRVLHPDTFISAEDAAKRDAETGDAYTLARNVLTTGLAPYTAGLEYLKDRAFNEGSWAGGQGDSYADYINKHMEAGNKGEGVVGFLGNPTNVLAAKMPLTLGGMAGMAGLGAGESMYHDLEAGRLSGSPVDVTEAGKNALIAGGLAGGLHGAVSGASWLGKETGQAIAKPYIDIQREAEEQIAENARKAAILERIKQNAPENARIQDYIDAVDNEGNPAFEAKLEQRRRQNEMARRQELRQQERHASPDEERLRRDRPELFYIEPEYIPYDPNVEYGKQMETAEILRGVKAMMRRNAKDFPEYQVGKVDLKGFGNYLVEPTDEAAARYLAELGNQKAPDISGKGFELLKGYPNVQRGLSAYAELPQKIFGIKFPGSDLARGVADKSFVLPNMMNTPGFYQYPAHAVAPLFLRGSVAGSKAIDEKPKESKEKK